MVDDSPYEAFRMFFFFFFMNKKSWKEWSALASTLDLVRKKYPTMTMGAFRLFMEITRDEFEGRTPRATLKDLAERLDVPYATLTRQTDYLGSGIAQKGGLGLIEKKPVKKGAKKKGKANGEIADEEMEEGKDGKEKNVFLTVQGMALAEMIDSIIMKISESNEEQTREKGGIEANWPDINKIDTAMKSIEGDRSE